MTLVLLLVWVEVGTRGIQTSGRFTNKLCGWGERVLCFCGRDYCESYAWHFYITRSVSLISSSSHHSQLFLLKHKVRSRINKTFSPNSLYCSSTVDLYSWSVGRNTGYFPDLFRASFMSREPLLRTHSNSFLPIIPEIHAIKPEILKASCKMRKERRKEERRTERKSWIIADC